MKKYYFLVLSFVSFSQTSYSRIEFAKSNTISSGVEEYRLGDEWGKKKITKTGLKSESEVFKRAALATAYLEPGGTSFYLGKFNDSHVIATNHHVCLKSKDCLNTQADFKLLGKKFKITTFYATIPEIDLALMEISIPKNDEALMNTVAKNFSFDRMPKKGLKLITIGFGVGGNSNDYLMGNQDSDCRILSEDNEVRQLADPDEINPMDYKAWSFAHSCDISHGDSGSAMVDRKNGDILGIVWTGKFPKIPDVQDSSILEKIFRQSSHIIWTDMNYAVPAHKIRETLENFSNDKKIKAQTRNVFKAIIKG
jgi:hypothetical protein